MDTGRTAITEDLSRLGFFKDIIEAVYFVEKKRAEAFGEILIQLFGPTLEMFRCWIERKALDYRRLYVRSLLETFAQRTQFCRPS
jgi:hypothetical protein